MALECGYQDLLAREKFDISYRLIMDPGGYIPDLLVEMINEVALVSLFKDVLKEARSRRLNY